MVKKKKMAGSHGNDKIYVGQGAGKREITPVERALMRDGQLGWASLKHRERRAVQRGGTSHSNEAAGGEGRAAVRGQEAPWLAAGQGRGAGQGREGWGARQGRRARRGRERFSS